MIYIIPTFFEADLRVSDFACKLSKTRCRIPVSSGIKPKVVSKTLKLTRFISARTIITKAAAPNIIYNIFIIFCLVLIVNNSYI